MCDPIGVHGSTRMEYSPNHSKSHKCLHAAKKLNCPQPKIADYTVEMDDIDAIEDGILGGEGVPLMISKRVSKVDQLRQAGLQRIQKDMFTVNQLYKDLSGMVIQQGDTIHSLDSSVSNSVENSSKARMELEKTYKRQKERQALALKLALILLGFIVFIFLSRRVLFSHW